MDSTKYPLGLISINPSFEKYLSTIMLVLSGIIVLAIDDASMQALTIDQIERTTITIASAIPVLFSIVNELAGLFGR